MKEEVLRRALEIMFEKVDKACCQNCHIGNTCEGDSTVCIEYHIAEARSEVE